MAKQKMTLANFLAFQREKLGGMSQAELAKRCGVPTGTIASIESGYAKSPRTITLKKIAEGLFVPPEIIYKLASNPDKETPIAAEELKVYRINFIGRIPTNEDLEPFENSDTLLVFPIEFVNMGDYIVSIKGDVFSEEDIYDQDYIIINQQNYLKRSGDLMLCKIGGTTTLKRIYKDKGSYKIKESSYLKEDISFLGKCCMTISKRLL